MQKFLSWNFIVLIFLVLILLVIHEFGHWIAYRLCGYEAKVRKSILIPGIDPKEDIEVSKIQGLFIALNGFFFSTLVEVLPLMICGYKLWKVLLIGSMAGASVDFIWAIGMLFQKKICISSNR